MAKQRPKFQKERPPDPAAVETGWRLFIALPMPPAAQALVAWVTNSLAGHDLPVRWVAAEAAHLTLHFIGETAPEQAELLRLSLRATVARHPRFTLCTGDLGLFPDFRQPRVLWLGLGGETAALVALHADLGRTLARFGFEVETRRYHPHITLGRVREGAPANLGLEIRRAYENPALVRAVNDEATAIAVGEVLLMRSYLERAGARHEPLAVYPLTSNPAAKA